MEQHFLPDWGPALGSTWRLARLHPENQWDSSSTQPLRKPTQIEGAVWTWGLQVRDWVTDDSAGSPGQRPSHRAWESWCFLLLLLLLPSYIIPHSTTKLWKTELFVYELARSCQLESTEIACNTLQHTHMSNLTLHHARDSRQADEQNPAFPHPYVKHGFGTCKEPSCPSRIPIEAVGWGSVACQQHLNTVTGAWDHNTSQHSAIIL